MELFKFYENTQRGTPDFPIEYHHITESHPKYIMQAHWHKDIEIILVSRGQLRVSLNNIPYHLNAGESLFIPGGIIHSAEPEKCEYECLVFSPSVLYATQKIRTSIKSKLTAPVKFSNNDNTAKLFENYRTSKEGHEFDTVSKLYAIAAAAYKTQKDTSINTEYKIEKIKTVITFIEENYSQNITLAELSACCSMSANYFCKFFKEVTLQTPIEYITTDRLEIACEMLLSGATVTDTAYNCGFNDMSYFIHIFKKRYGISPKQYATNNMKKSRYNN